MASALQKKCILTNSAKSLSKTQTKVSKLEGKNSKKRLKNGKYLTLSVDMASWHEMNFFFFYFTAASERFDILPYEEMALYYPQANQKRPLILVGPPSIGRHELRLRLLEDTSRFAAAVPRKYSFTVIPRKLRSEFLLRCLLLFLSNSFHFEIRIL